MKNKIRKPLKGILQIFSANMIVKAFAIVSLAYFTRHLTKEEMAILPAFLMLSSLSGVFFNFGLYPTMLKVIPSLALTNLERAKSIINTIGIIMIMNAVVFSLATFLLSEYVSNWIFNSDKYQLIIEILSVGFLCRGINNFQQYVMQAFSRFGQMSKIVLITNIIRIGLTLVLTIFYGAIGLAVGLTITQFIVTVFSFFQLKDILFSTFKFENPQRLIKDSLPFYLEGFLMYFKRDGDNLLITIFLSPEILSLYYIAKRLADLTNTFFNTLDSVLTSNLSKIKDNKEKFKLKTEEILHTFNLLVLPVTCLVAVISPTFIFYIGSNYTDAIFPSIILVFGPYFKYYFTITFGRAIFLFSPASSRFLLTLIETAILFLSLAIFGYLWGLIGVALANIVSGIGTGLYAHYKVNKSIFLIDLGGKEFVNIFLIACVMVFPVIYVQFYWGYNIFSLIGAYLVGISLFIIIIHFTISEKFYRLINSLSPIKISDPIKFILSKV